jgi:predicted transcriptional regulator
MKKSYRSKLKILYDVLVSIERLEYDEGRALPTKIMYLSNLSYDRLNIYLRELLEKGLIVRVNDGYSLTQEGAKFMSEIRKMISFLSAFGLEL